MVILTFRNGHHEIVICRDAIVGAATSRPQRNGTARLVEWHAIRTHCRGGSQPPAFVPGQKCSAEWYHVRHSTNSPKLIRYCRFVPRGRLRASPTVLSWCCGNSPNPVHHFWLVLRGRLIAAPTMTYSLNNNLFVCRIGLVCAEWSISHERKKSFFRENQGLGGHFFRNVVYFLCVTIPKPAV